MDMIDCTLQRCRWEDLVWPNGINETNIYEFSELSSPLVSGPVRILISQGEATRLFSRLPLSVTSRVNQEEFLCTRTRRY